MAVELASAYVSLVPSARGIAGKIGSELGDVLEDEGKRGGEKATEGFGSGWASKIGAVALAAGAAAGAALVAGVLTGLDNERETDRIAASLGLTPEESELAGSIAGDLYAQAYGESFGQVADAVGAVSQSLSSFSDPAELEDLTAAALNFSSAFGEDVNETVALAGLLIQEGIAKDGTEAFDLLTASIQEVPAAMRGDFTDSIQEYIPFLDQLGLSAEESFGLLVDAANEGPFALDKTGDALKELTIRSTDMSTASVEAYDLMGLSAEETAAKILAGGDEAREGFDEIIAGLLSIEDPVAQANAAVALFGTPIEDLSTGEIPDFLASLSDMDSALGDVAGSADEMGETLNDNTATDIEAFKRQALQGIADFAVRYAIPAIQTLAGWVSDDLLPAVRGVSDWARENQPILIGVATAIGVPLVAAFVSWAVSAAAAAAATLLAMAPIIAVGVAVGVLAALIVTHWETIQRATTTVKDWIVDRFNEVVGFFTGLPGRITGAIGDVFGPIRTKATEAKDWVWEKVEDIVGFITGLPGRVRTAASGVFDGLKDSFTGVLVDIIEAWNRIDISFSVPDIWGVPNRGESFDIIPDVPVPRFHSGGIVPGRPGEEVLAILEAGEGITSAADMRAGRGTQYVFPNYVGDRSELVRTMDWRERQQRLAAASPGVR